MKSAALPPVVILCGGKGTRLGDVTKVRPKPLVAVGGMPILWHILKLYSHYGFKDFVLCLGYLGDLIEEFFTRGTLRGQPSASEPPTEPDWNVTFADTGQETATSGRVFRIRKHLERSERFFLTYGDGVASVPIDRLLEFHRAKGCAATVTAVHPTTTYGVILEEGGIAKGFEEKPTLPILINGGFFVLERRALEYVEEAGPFEQRPLRRLAKEGELAVYRHEGFWQCMDDQKQVDLLNAMWEEGDRPWAAWQNREVRST